MYRYVAITWDARVEEQTQAAAAMAASIRCHRGEWTCVLKGDGFQVLHAGFDARVNKAYPIGREAGVVLGRLFASSSEDTKRLLEGRLDGATSAAIVATRGEHLIHRYWGRYVAFLVDAAAGTLDVVRDPTGGLPCLLTQHRGVQICFSSFEDCAPLSRLRFSMNWKYIQAHVAFRTPALSETGINEIVEIQPGERAKLHGRDRSRQLLWDPVHIAQSAVIEELDAAAALLREATRSCVRSWASCYDGILHTLSGGLDSSIVMSCLKDMPGTRVSCVNYFTPEAEGDERAFARLSAAQAGYPLLEHQRNSSGVKLDASLRITRSAKPWFYLYYIEHGAFEHELAREHGASAIFSGGGGDALFYQARGGYAAADYVRTHGLGSRLMRIALDAACMERVSVWSVLGSAFREGLNPQPLDFSEDTARFRTLVSHDLVASAATQAYAHPLLARYREVPKGKLWQILSMVVPHSYYDPFDVPAASERVPPLVSQPIMELCLKTPTYVLTAGGWDRAVARRAFVQDVPGKIIQRRAKGGISSHVKRVFQANLPFIRELLLDGQLSRYGLLDRARLTECLSGSRPLTGMEFSEIQDHVSTEGWLRSWESATQHAAAA